MNNEERKIIEADIKKLSKTELKDKYLLTYNAWANMKKRKKSGAIISQEFNLFDGFLSIVGARLSKDYTLDRINNDDPEYAEGKVFWHDKHTQNNNRSNNVHLKHEDGRELTISQWAEVTKQKPSTLYKRHSNGWLDMEIITGQRISFDTSVRTNPFPYKTRSKWETRYSQHIINGGGLSKLEFLWHQLSNINPLRNEVLILEALINRKQRTDFICDCDDYCDGSCNYDYLDHIADMGDKKAIEIAEGYTNNSMESLNCKLKKIKPFVDEYDFIFSQVNEMYKYVLMKEKAIEKKHKSIDKATVIKHFEALNPKPFYNINLPEKIG